MNETDTNVEETQARIPVTMVVFDAMPAVPEITVAHDPDSGHVLLQGFSPYQTNLHPARAIELCQAMECAALNGQAVIDKKIQAMQDDADVTSDDTRTKLHQRLHKALVVAQSADTTPTPAKRGAPKG